MRSWVLLLVLFLTLAPGLMRGGEDAEFKTLADHPLERMYKVRDEHGRRLSLLQWKVGTRFYFVLKETASGEVLERVAADSMKTVPTIFRDEEIQLMVKPETKESDGKVTPAVYENRSRKVATQSEFTSYLRDGKLVVSIPNSALPGVLPDITIGDVVYMGGHERASGSWESLKDSDPAGAFSIDAICRPLVPAAPAPVPAAPAVAVAPPPAPAPAPPAQVNAPNPPVVAKSVTTAASLKRPNPPAVAPPTPAGVKAAKPEAGAPPAPAVLSAANPSPLAPLPQGASGTRPPDEYTLFDSVGRNFAFYVWEVDGKWYFVLADGSAVKKKIVADWRIVVPGVYEERQRQNCVKGASVDSSGKIIPPVFVDDSYKAPVKYETTWYTGSPEQVQWMSNRKIMIGDELYSMVREPADDNRGGRPAKAKEGDF